MEGPAFSKKVRAKMRAPGMIAYMKDRLRQETKPEC